MEKWKISKLDFGKFMGFFQKRWFKADTAPCNSVWPAQCGLVLIVWPHQETVGCQNHHQLVAVPSVPGPRWQCSGHPLAAPKAPKPPPAPMPLPGVITSHYPPWPVSRAGRNKPSGHFKLLGLATYTIRLWPLTRGQGQATPELSANSITQLFNWPAA